MFRANGLTLQIPDYSRANLWESMGNVFPPLYSIEKCSFLLFIYRFFLNRAINLEGENVESSGTKNVRKSTGFSKIFRCIFVTCHIIFFIIMILCLKLNLKLFKII